MQVLKKYKLSHDISKMLTLSAQVKDTKPLNVYNKYKIIHVLASYV
jgi:hypothetical protein